MYAKIMGRYTSESYSCKTISDERDYTMNFYRIKTLNKVLKV